MTDPKKPQAPRPKVLGVEVPPLEDTLAEAATKIRLPAPMHATRTAQKTLRDLPPPPASASAPGAPPTKSLSPPPPSIPPSVDDQREAARLRVQLEEARQEAAELRRRQVEAEVERSPLGAARKALLRRLMPWLAATAGSLVISVAGWVWGQAKGYMDAFERVSRLEGAFRVERDRRAKLDGQAAAALANVNADLDTAFAKNRDQDAKLGKLDELLKEAPVVVRPKP